MQISRKLTEIEMIKYQRKPHETSSQFLWSYHLGRDDLDLTLIHPALLRCSDGPNWNRSILQRSRAAAVGVVSTQRFRTFYKILSL